MITKLLSLLRHGAKRIGNPAPRLRQISASQHRIAPNLVSKNAIRVCETLQQQGYAAYVVGGAVRDLLLGIVPKDFDVATNATPEQVQQCFRRARIIGRRFRLVHVLFGNDVIEVSTFRALNGGEAHLDEHGRVLRDNIFGSIEDDAARRDFTINALYYDPATQRIMDYHGGFNDVSQHRIRMIGDPAARYREDPVRMLRAVRFAAKLQCTLEANTRAPIREMGELLRNVPSARLFDEMLKLLSSGHAMACLCALRDEGLHHGLLPILDLVFENAQAERFVSLALAQTDERVRAGKTLSPSFLFATLLWHQVFEQWQALIKQGQLPMPALDLAADAVIDRQAQALSIQRRFVADIRDIWFMQPRFEKRAPRTVYRMLEQPRFRAAMDFFVLRAQAGEVDDEAAQWWLDFAAGSDTERARLVDSLAPSPATAGPRRRRRRRAGASSSSSALSDNAVE